MYFKCSHFLIQCTFYYYLIVLLTCLTSFYPVHMNKAKLQGMVFKRAEQLHFEIK